MKFKSFFTYSTLLLGLSGQALASMCDIYIADDEVILTNNGVQTSRTGLRTNVSANTIQRGKELALEEIKDVLREKKFNPSASEQARFHLIDYGKSCYQLDTGCDTAQAKLVFLDTYTDEEFGFTEKDYDINLNLLHFRADTDNALENVLERIPECNLNLREEKLWFNQMKDAFN